MDSIRMPAKTKSNRLLAFVILCGGLLACPGIRADSKLPTLWIIGDSTVNNSGKGLRGWGSEIDRYFLAKKINVENRARGGCSSRSFLADGLWDDVLAEMKRGDVVLMQFGHNDGGGKYFNEKGRASIHGNGDETEEGDLPDGKHVVVHSYGWYLRRYIADTQEKEGTPIVLSPIPRNRWNDEGTVGREDKGYGLWAKEAAQKMKVPFLDLNEIVCDYYDKMGKDRVDDFFEDDWTHTNVAGAKFNARCVVEGLYKMPGSSLNRYMVSTSKMRRLLAEDEP